MNHARNSNSFIFYEIHFLGFSVFKRKDLDLKSFVCYTEDGETFFFTRFTFQSSILCPF